MRLPAACLVILSFALLPQAERGKLFVITVVDSQTSRGVPLVELETVNNIRYVTDSNGVVAFYEPGLMDQTVFFHVKSHGYEFPKDGFGYRGKALKITEGGSACLKIERTNIAERLYRITGAGIYRDSVMAGMPVPTKHPVLNGQVFGSDSVENAVYRGKIYWFWGDTNRPGYPLGNFHVPGATSLLQSAGGLDPEAGVDLEYLLNESGFAKPTAQMPGEGPTWISGLVPLRGDEGRERLFASYVKVRGVLEVYEHGLVEFDDEKQQFEKAATFPNDAATYPSGHPFVQDDHGVRFVYFANPYPLTRVRADAEHLKQLESYEAFTPLKQGSRLSQPELDRDEKGLLLYGWKANTPALNPTEEGKLIKSGALKPEEALFALRDAETGKAVAAHGGSVYWNPFRGRWVMITVESFGTSLLGEIWYAEADTPLGPWVYARKVVTHDKYSFYNPKQHPMFDKDGGRVIYFEGTYTHTFSGNDEQTPRYDYNQVMYKLDLSHPRLSLPVAVYVTSDPRAPNQFATLRKLRAALPPPPSRPPAAFLALERPGESTVAVYQSAGAGGLSLRVGTPPVGESVQAVFHALPAELEKPPATAVPLHEFVDDTTGRRAYSTDLDWAQPGFRRSAKPICLVWRNPVRVPLPPALSTR